MNMRLPEYLVESDPLLTNVPQLEGEMEVTAEEWTAEELENAERQVEQVLMEEAFIEACFEEMLQEEDSQWYHYTGVSMPNMHYTTHMPNLQYTAHTTTYMSPGHHTDSTYTGNMVYYCSEQFSSEQRLGLTSKLNPEAPEFIPRSVAS